MLQYNMQLRVQDKVLHVMTRDLTGSEAGVRIQPGMDALEHRCQAEGLRMTPLRCRVLAILLAEKRALGAYG